MSTQTNKNKNNHWSQQNWVKFMNGGLSGMAATCFVQPLNLVKTR